MGLPSPPQFCLTVTWLFNAWEMVFLYKKKWFIIYFPVIIGQFLRVLTLPVWVYLKDYLSLPSPHVGDECLLFLIAHVPLFCFAEGASEERADLGQLRKCLS